MKYVRKAMPPCLIWMRSGQKNGVLLVEMIELWSENWCSPFLYKRFRPEKICFQVCYETYKKTWKIEDVKKLCSPVLSSRYPWLLIWNRTAWFPVWYERSQKSCESRLRVKDVKSEGMWCLGWNMKYTRKAVLPCNIWDIRIRYVPSLKWEMSGQNSFSHLFDMK